MEVICMIAVVVFGLPMLIVYLLTMASWKYHDYLHDKDEPTKEEWKVKR